MEYFNIKRPIFIVPSNKCCEEFDKIDKFLKILNKSEIGPIIKKFKEKQEEKDMIHLIWWQLLFIVFQNLKVLYEK